MSATSTLVTEAHFDYIRSHTAREDPFLVELKAAARAHGLPPIWIAHEQAVFVQILLRAARAKTVVEVGTLAGSTAISMARALPPDGKVLTIEIDPRHADFAEEWIAKSDVAGKIEVLRGKGVEVLPRLAADSADVAFLDADKVSYGLYLEQSLRIVRRGGMVLVDNAFAFGQLFDERPTDREVPAVRAFNEQMAKERRLTAVIVPLGDGCWVGVRD
jgi:predicted O-methyltransferase YrrM